MTRSGKPPHTDADRPAPNPHPLPRAERAEIQRQGAKAAARGEPADTNPLGQPRNRPSATGESTATWWQRRLAWEQGHAAQTAARRRTRPSALPAHADERD